MSGSHSDVDSSLVILKHSCLYISVFSSTLFTIAVESGIFSFVFRGRDQGRKKAVLRSEGSRGIGLGSRAWSWDVIGDLLGGVQAICYSFYEGKWYCVKRSQLLEQEKHGRALRMKGKEIRPPDIEGGGR